MLNELPAHVVEELAERSLSRSYRRGDTLVFQGDPTATVYYVTGGHAAVKVGTPQGETITVGIVGVGDTFGELSHLTGREQRTASVVAIDDVAARVISTQEFEKIREKFPQIDKLLLRYMARRIDSLSELLAQSVYETVNRRCARRLYEVADMFRDGTEAVTVPITQDDLAGLAGASRPTVNQILGQLQDARIVSTGRGTITVNSMPALKVFAR
nr:Crp/Fnr family transcriptional regulator [Leifsonia sp. Leaf325]